MIIDIKFKLTPMNAENSNKIEHWKKLKAHIYRVNVLIVGQLSQIYQRYLAFCEESMKLSGMLL